MEVLITDLKSILNLKLSVYQRGLIFTALLVKEDNPKMTLAKFKTVVNMKEAKLALMLMHKKGIIKWSGYNAAVKSVENAKVSPDIKEAITFMNDLYKRRFDYNSESTVKGLRNRLKEHDLKTIKGVIANRYEVWANCSVMKSNLNPTTIFRPSKFPKYLEDYQTTKRGSGIISVDKLQLKDGDPIFSHNVGDLVDTEIYPVKVFEINEDGDRIGQGKKMNVYGKKLKTMVKIEIDNENFGGFANKEYFYNKSN